MNQLYIQVSLAATIFLTGLLFNLSRILELFGLGNDDIQLGVSIFSIIVTITATITAALLIKDAMK